MPCSTLDHSIDELSAILNTNKTDIAAISETWLPSYADPSYLHISGYSLFSRPRSHKRGGGVAFYIRETFQVNPLQHVQVPEQLEVLWMWARPSRLPRSVCGLILAVLYHPPASPFEDLLIEHLVSTLDILQTKYPPSGIIILGYFNKMDTDVLGRLTGLDQIVNTPTRGPAILVKILTNLKNHYHAPQVTVIFVFFPF